MAYLLVKNGTLIDGNGGPPISDAAVLIQEKRIKWVGRWNDMKLPNEKVNVIDAQGGFILPGFIDSHVHMMMSGNYHQELMSAPFSLKFYQAIQHMKRTIDVGITSVRDAGYTDVGVKEAVERGWVLGPRMQISVTPLTITGGHGDFWLRSGLDVTECMTYPTMPDGICDGREQVRQKVREVLRSGADLIKVHATGGIMSPTDHPEFTQFSLEELSVMVEEAAFRRGAKVMAHAQGLEGVKNAVRAGVHSIEHGIFLDDEAIELMVENGTYLVPTLIAGVGVLEVGKESGNIPAHALRKAQEVVDIHCESFAKAYQAGVKISMGTDAGVVPHGINLRELSLMCQAGMHPMEAIVAATKTAADCLGWEDRLGTVESGKLADIVISKTDPIADIQSLENPDHIVAVIKNGCMVKDLLTSRCNSSNATP